MLVLVRSLATAFVLFTAGAASNALADPPARVGRISLIEGDVTFHDTAVREAAPATLNWPVTGGAGLSTAPGGRAEVRIGSTAVRLDGATALTFARLDDQSIRLDLQYGAVTVRVRSREVADAFVLETRDARVLLTDAGRYRFEAGRAPDTTAVTVFQGGAQVDASGTIIAVRPGRRAEVGFGGGTRIGEAVPDELDNWTLARDQRDDAAHSPRYVSPETTGYESLDDYGDWRATPEYGPVWYPRAVPVGWAPYRAGRWAWVEPWGWTWIDEAPWGFAPFHYGRWALMGGAWGWVPGAFVARPVYAPALVGWIGRPGWSVTIGIGSVPAVGWFPLAPREVFVPAYRASPVYVRNVNVTHVTNIVNVTNVQPTYAHRHVERAVTVVPAAAVSGGQPVGRSAMRVRHADLVADDGASNAPPATAGRPPRQFGVQRRDNDGRWTRRPQPVATPTPPAANAPTARTPASPVTLDRERRRDEVERRPEQRVERERPAPSQPAPVVTSPAPPVAAERERRRDEPSQRPEQRVERVAPQTTPPVAAPLPPLAIERERRPDGIDRRPETRVDANRPAPPQPAPAVTAPAPPVAVERERRREESIRRPEAVVPRERPVAAPVVTAPTPPRALAPPAPRERAERRDEPRAAVVAPMPRAPAPMQPPSPAVRAPAPSVALPQAAPREQRAPRPEGNRGQPREARRGEQRGG
jgi:hypothetical protein